MLDDWVFDDNLRAFLLSLSWFVGYAFDEGDWLTIRRGMEGTDQEADRWFDYEFAGELLARFRLAADPGSSVIHVRVEVPAIAVPQVEAAVAIFQHFHVLADA